MWGLQAGRPANSVSHPREWAQFIRVCTKKKTHITELAPYIKDSKQDLLNVWLANNKDCSKCVMTLKRRQIHT